MKPERCADIIEGTNSMQAVCPVCKYGEGYCEPILAGPGNSLVRVVCQTCGTKFIAPALVSYPKVPDEKGRFWHIIGLLVFFLALILLVSGL